ncbi:PREDICTED: wall-associated receptor kinase-like 1 [Erythranthe guttata]|uniref:wall-associated receptor kinase-like 1 n=1 Tax=Erythranthe guttata TaxID=4155 RepID=UPI00064DFC52|nr:PREDICTED: wall-associated receptor kinase-like 1 [Erythranthe guttata]|eukprot:XP_012848338.1 PREDICTED: wall-associated receptor kinase-like 1 [Erythranthe guttata]
MVELLTGEKAISTIRADAGRSLATHFLHSMDENCLFDILDARVLNEGRREEIAAIAELAKRCLHLNGRRRPTMKEVAVELEGIQMRKEGGSVIQQNQDDDDITELSHDIFSSISTNMHTEYSLTPYSPDYDDRSLLNRP